MREDTERAPGASSRASRIAELRRDIAGARRAEATICAAEEGAPAWLGRRCPEWLADGIENMHREVDRLREEEDGP